MKMRIFTIKSGFVFILLFNFIYGIGQALNKEETIQYINEKLLAFSIGPDDEKSTDQIKVDKDGNLIITLVSISKISPYTQLTKANIKDLSTYVIKNPMNGNYSSIIIYCLQGENCVTTNIKFTSSTSNNTSDKIYIYLNAEHQSVLSLCNAFSHLIKLVQEEDATIKSNDPFASNPKRNSDISSNIIKGNNSDNKSNKSDINDKYCTVKMIQSNSGIYEVPVLLNDVLKINFIYDSGASDVSISPDVAFTLIRTGTIKSSDFIGSQKYQFADGSIAESKMFIIRKMKIGKFEIYNIKASISNSTSAPILLGQSALSRFRKVNVDNSNHTLTIFK